MMCRAGWGNCLEGFKQPRGKVADSISHPNIDKLGRICLDILKDKWSPALQIRTVLYVSLSLAFSLSLSLSLSLALALVLVLALALASPAIVS